MSLPAARGPALVAERDELALAMDRACGARPIEGNSIELYSESPRALDAMLELIARAERWVHFENYIIRGDRTGRRFADALEARARAGVPLPPDERVGSAEATGGCTARIVEGVPGRARIYRAVQLLAAGAAQRLWITDAYLIPPAALYASLLDAARDGVDVRLLVPGTSDIPVLRNFTRVGYRELLRAGVRVFEYQGPMLHAKTLVADRRWARVGSSNLNVSSLLTNYELDVVVESEPLTDALARQFERDLGAGAAREIALVARRSGRLPARLMGTPATSGDALTTTGEHKRSGYELGAVAFVALRRVAGGLRRAIAWTAALTCAGLGALLLLFPRVTSIVLAAGTFWLAVTFGLYALERRRAREYDDDGL